MAGDAGQEVLCCLVQSLGPDKTNLPVVAFIVLVAVSAGGKEHQKAGQSTFSIMIWTKHSGLAGGYYSRVLILLHVLQEVDFDCKNQYWNYGQHQGLSSFFTVQGVHKRTHPQT